MLQQRTAGYKALDNMRSRGEFPPRWNAIAELGQAVDRSVERFMEERMAAAKELGPGFVLTEMLDRLVRTSEQEQMDSPLLDGEQKLAMSRALDRMNRITVSYQHQIDLLRPLIVSIADRCDGTVKVLELAAGSGGLALALAAESGRSAPGIEVTASDIVQEIMEEGRRIASESGLPVRFKWMDACSFEGLEPGSADLVVISQSMHHFTPGQLAVMIARAEACGAKAFAGIDGHRSLTVLGGVPLIASLQGIEAFTNDGMTSARKFYSEIELDIIAETAVRNGTHRTACSWPFSALQILFGGDAK